MPRSSSPRRGASGQKPASTKNNGGQVRIIGGRWRSRKIEFPGANGLRPTGDRIRETLFNWLQQDVIGARCLDLFAGSGVLGIEAISRGAAHCTFIDNYEPACSSLQQQLSTLNAEPAQANVVRNDALNWLKTTKPVNQFDIAFIDPPFAQDISASCCELLEASTVLSDNALIYVETQRRPAGQQTPDNWQQLRSKSSGQVTYSLYQRMKAL
ncbi:MAG: 16S rRNA (guanine(966)-N(2))-methyltransferase RsmD [Pseudomonadales bacterium]|nr:16S rRNA (guanine(966)-N(2))-methyltransferase RsmD [Pseudomonadales bacterium]